MALPWGGPDLAQSAPADLDRLFTKVAAPQPCKFLTFLRIS